MAKKGMVIDKDGYEVPGMPSKICYSLGTVGTSLVYGVVSSFLTKYYTDSVGISAAFVGTMMLMARILDGGSDILMGVVIEKTNTRWGKARPWIPIGGILLAISVLFLFNVPENITLLQKNIYTAVTYIFMSVICYTIVGLAHGAMLPRFSPSQNDRVFIGTIGMLIAIPEIILYSTLTPWLLERFGGSKSQQGWTAVSIVYGLLAIVCILICFFGAKENVVKEEKKEKISILPILKLILKNRYFYIVVVLTITSQISSACMMGGLTYYAEDVLGNLNLYSMLNVSYAFAGLLIVPFVPVLTKKIGRRRIILIGAFMSVLSTILPVFAPDNLPLVIISLVLRTIAAMPITLITATFAGDIVDFIAWRDGIRAEGMVTSANSFGSKVGMGLGAAVLGWVLAIGGYSGTLEVQTATSQSAIIATFTWIPCICNLIILIALWFWDIDKYRPQIDAALKRTQSEL